MPKWQVFAVADYALATLGLSLLLLSKLEGKPAGLRLLDFYFPDFYLHGGEMLIRGIDFLLIHARHWEWRTNKDNTTDWNFKIHEAIRLMTRILWYIF